MVKVLLVDVVRRVTHGGRGVPRPRPLGELTALRVCPLNNDLASDGLLGLDCGMAIGVVLGDGFGHDLWGNPRCHWKQFRHVCQVPLLAISSCR